MRPCSTRVGHKTRSGWSKAISGLVDLRNDVMHPVKNVVLAKGGLIRLQDREN